MAGYHYCYFIDLGHLVPIHRNGIIVATVLAKCQMLIKSLARRLGLSDL